jgi:hypothetical protein
LLAAFFLGGGASAPLSAGETSAAGAAFFAEARFAGAFAGAASAASSAAGSALAAFLAGAFFGLAAG